jgi:hypothetical protein
MTGEAQEEHREGAIQTQASTAERKHDIAGINEEFKKPDLDVEQWVKRWEGESREIYTERAKIVEALALKPGMQVADVGPGLVSLWSHWRRRWAAGRVYARIARAHPAHRERARAPADQRGGCSFHGRFLTLRTVRGCCPGATRTIIVPAVMLRSIHQAPPGGRCV